MLSYCFCPFHVLKLWQLFSAVISFHSVFSFEFSFCTLNSLFWLVYSFVFLCFMKSIVCIKETDLEPGKCKTHIILMRLISFESYIYCWSPELPPCLNECPYDGYNLWESHHIIFCIYFTAYSGRFCFVNDLGLIYSYFLAYH